MSPAEIDRTTRALEATEAAMARPAPVSIHLELSQSEAALVLSILVHDSKYDSDGPLGSIVDRLDDEYAKARGEA